LVKLFFKKVVLKRAELWARGERRGIFKLVEEG
jgi:hypothetical protein